MERIELKFEAPELEVAHYRGRMYGEEDCERLIENTSEVYTPRGELLAKYTNGFFPAHMATGAYEALKSSATASDSIRGYATGKVEGKVQDYRLLKDGTRSRTRVAAGGKITSGTVGHIDRYTRFPYCRQTAWTMRNKENFIKALPLLQAASDAFAVMVPRRYAVQKSYVENTHREWLVPGTVLTTITVNSNWQTAQHCDKGDLRGGFGVMINLGQDFEGGWLLYPKYKVAFNMRPGDLILADVHEWHCNTPIRLLKPGAERLSLVCYYRENMERCGTVEEELETAKNRQVGDPLWGPEAPLFE